MSEYLKKPKYILSSQNPPYICRLKVKGWAKIYFTYMNQKKARMSNLMSDKVYFRIRRVTKAKKNIT